MDKFAASLHTSNQVEVLKQWVWPATADDLVNVAPDEDAGIAVAQAKPAKVWIDLRHLPGRVMVTLKDEGEISTNRCTIAQRIEDRFNGTMFRSGIGMNKPQCGSRGVQDRASNLATTTALAGDDAHAEAGSDLHCSIFATSVGDEDFLVAA